MKPTLHWETQRVVVRTAFQQFTRSRFCLYQPGCASDGIVIYPKSVPIEPEGIISKEGARYYRLEVAYWNGEELHLIVKSGIRHQIILMQLWSGENMFSQADYENYESQLENAKLFFKLSFGITTTRPDISYLQTFSYERHTATFEELSLTKEQEGIGFAALEHCATYLCFVQINTVLEAIYPRNHFNSPHHSDLAEKEIHAAFQIARLIRNSFAHNPFAPQWQVKAQFQNINYEVVNVMSLNTTSLDGKILTRRDYGGPLAVLRLVEYTQKVLKQRLLQEAASVAQGED